MQYLHNSKHTGRARALRKNSTEQENHLRYDFLSTYPARFHRQATVDRYIVDFYCAKAKLVIEIDGSQHYMDEGIEYDIERSKVLNSCGLSVIRFSNREIDTEFSAVCEHIHNTEKDILGCDPYDGQ